MDLSNKICKTAGCPQFEDWAIANKLCVKWGYAKRGDIVLFDFNHNGTSDHIGIVTAVHSDYIETIEGNTGSNQTNGDGVYRKKRYKSEVNYFVRPKITDKEREAVIKTATSQIGYKEGKNNDNKYGKWFKMNRCSWCCIFVVWCFAHAKEVKQMETYKGGLPTLSRKVKIGQAKHDERGKIRGGKVGDQTGHEVSVDNWTYSSKKKSWKNWKYVARPRSEKVARQMANEMTDICNSPKVGYNQAPKGGRSALYRRLKKAHWDVSKIVKTDTSCTPSVCACINSAGVKIATGISASQLRGELAKTRAFTIHTADKYTTSSKLLKAGDVLSSGKHTAMVVDCGTGELKRGDKGSNVTLWQKFLAWYGNSIKIDGDFGERTEEHTKNFQYHNGLTVDGIVGEKTLAKARTVKK